MQTIPMWIQSSLSQGHPIQNCEKDVQGKGCRSVLSRQIRHQIQNIQSTIQRQRLQEHPQILYTMLVAQIWLWLPVQESVQAS